MRAPDPTSRHLVTGRMGAVGLVIGSATSTQLGAAFAVKLFPLSSPTMAAFIRNVVGALALLALLGLRRGSMRGVNLRDAAVLGVILGTMNATFYEAINRLPLGDAVCIEFTGPIAVAGFASQGRRELAFVGMAALGILAIGHPGRGHLDYPGLVFVFLAAACWAGWVIFGRRVATGPRRTDTLTLAMIFSSAWLMFPALLRSSSSLTDPRVLVLGLGIGLFSSALPYSLELLAMTRVSATAFGVLLSLQPLLAAIIGYLLLHQTVGWLETIGFALVVGASIGVNLSAGPTALQDPAPLAA
ncbi:MAG: EamA family transporter [Candidatus Dormibacteria bacterium]